MALTKFEVASSALVLIGAKPVASFSSTPGSTTEQVVCDNLYQSCLDHWLSVYPWRFGTKTVQLSRLAAKPVTLWQAAYQQPPDMKKVTGIRLNDDGHDIIYDRFENTILCNATETDKVWCEFAYEPPVAWWPGYFVQLMEYALGAKFAFALAGKLDLKDDLDKATEIQFRVAKNADSIQQTTQRLKLTGRTSIMAARRG